MTKHLRIDKLAPNTPVRLRFMAEYQGPGADYIDDVWFIGIEGEGPERRAIFSEMPDGAGWAAYRYKGRWAYGTSAETLRLVEVFEP